MVRDTVSGLPISPSPHLPGEKQDGTQAGPSLSGAAIHRIRNPRTPNSELVITPRPNGGVTITQGPAYILVGGDEVSLVIQALQAVDN